MKVNVKKKTIKIIIAIILIIAVIAVGVIITKSIINNNQIKDTEEKLSQIDAKELETKLIEELKKTKIYLNVENAGGSFETKFENIEGYTTAKITYKNYTTNTVEIPCFKIESDSKGKFKKILYFQNHRGIEKIIQETVENVFKKEYNIDTLIQGNSSYNKHFRKSGQSKKIKFDNKELFEIIYATITNGEVAKSSMYDIGFGI